MTTWYSSKATTYGSSVRKPAKQDAPAAPYVHTVSDDGDEQWSRVAAGDDGQPSPDPAGQADAPGQGEAQAQEGWNRKGAVPLDDDGNIEIEIPPEATAAEGDDDAMWDAGADILPQNFESAWKRPSDAEAGAPDADAGATGADDAAGDDDRYVDLSYGDLAAKCEEQGIRLDRLLSQNVRLSRQVESAVGQYKRLQEEWGAYRRRMKGEEERAKALASERIAQRIIPVIDDIYRSVAHMRSAGGEEMEAIADGNEAIAARMVDALGKEGIVVIRPVGEPFDETRHQAIALVDADGQGSGTVAQVFQDGYAIGDRVIRPAMVSVTK